MDISEKDKVFISGTLMPHFGVKKVRISYVPLTKKWPDIWVVKNKIPCITVTETWKRKTLRQRRVELVHEFLHLTGLEHGKIGVFNYNTIPEKDSYSEYVYEAITRD